jgi:Xaa-Pro aminopeptidase
MNPKNLKTELSLKEKERRWSLVRQKMADEGLAAIVVYGNNIHVREIPCFYLTNYVIIAGCEHALLFPVDGDPILLIISPLQAYFAKKISWIPAQHIYQSKNLGADLAKHVISLKLQKKRIGIESPMLWPTRDYLAIKELCPEIDLVEATELLSRIRRPKSSEELKLMEEAIRIGELAQRTFLSNLKPGMTEEQVVAKVEDVVRANGVERRLWLMSSTPEMAYPWLPGESVIRKPNPVVFSAEFQRTRGYACQVVRTFCWEEPKGEYKRMWELEEELRQMALVEIRPGRKANEVAAKVENLVNWYGFECDYIGHGLGVTYYEALYFNPRPEKENVNDWTIMADEVYVLHPQVRAKAGGGPLVFVGDMYFVGEKETKWMTPFLSGLPEMIPG